MESAAHRLAEESERLLPYTGGQERALRDQLEQAQTALGVLTLDRSAEDGLAGVLSRRASVIGSASVLSRPASVTGSLISSIWQRGGPGRSRVRVPRAPRDAAEISAAKTRLDRLRGARDFSSAVTAVVNAGWQARVNELTGQARHLENLLEIAGARRQRAALRRARKELPRNLRSYPNRRNSATCKRPLTRWPQ